MLASPQAIDVGVYVVRAFVHLRELVVSNKELALRLDELEHKTDLMSLKQEMFEHNTRVQLKQIIDALRELMAPPPEPAKKRPIGFVTTDEPPAKPKAAKRKSQASSLAAHNSSHPRNPRDQQWVGDGFLFKETR